MVPQNTYSVQVQCHFNSTIISGILILLLHNDPINSDQRGEILAHNVTRISSASVLLPGRVYGSHYITIHPIVKNSDLLGSRIPFGQKIDISESKTVILGKPYCILYF